MGPLKFYYVYILVSSSRRAMYTGVTNDLHHRRWEHRKLKPKTFSGRYRTTRLVYYEAFVLPSAAITREKEIKGWTRAKKDALVRAMNPRWKIWQKTGTKNFSLHWKLLKAQAKPRTTARSFVGEKLASSG